jgi:hypothetical protein
MPNQTLDPLLLVRGVNSDIVKLQALNATQIGRETLREGLSDFLDDFLAGMNHEDENIFFAGSFLKR